MRRRIVPYPTLSSTSIKRLGCTVLWRLLEGNRNLEFDEISQGLGQYRITDKTWYPDSKSLTVKLTVKIKYLHRLFDGTHGNEGCVVAERFSTLGVALQWRLPKSNLQGVCHCKDVSITSSGEMEFSGTLEFPPGVIRFALALDVVLYLKAPSKASPQGFYAKSRGAILGSLAQFSLLTGGGGGYFPTETVKEEGGQLWWIRANISCTEDFDEDFDSAVFCLFLNELHAAYRLVYVTSRNGKLLVSPVMFEIFVNACCILFQKACQHIPGKSWVLEKEEKDEQTVYVNFKALKQACLPDFSKKEILDMEAEELMLNVRVGLSRLFDIDLSETGK